MNKKNGISILSIIMGMLIILGLIGYIIYDKYNNNDNKDNDIVVDQEILSLYNTTNSSGCLWEAEEIYAYSNVNNNYESKLPDLYISEKLTNQIKLKLAYLKAESKSLDNLVVEKGLMESTLKDIFGNNTTYYFESLNNINGEEYIKYENNYSIIQGCGSGIDARDYFVTKLVDVKKEENKVYLIEKVIYVDITNINDDISNIEYTANIYNDYKKSSKLASDIKYDYYDEDAPEIDSYIKNASTYQYTFSKENGNYYFTNFERID